MAAPSRPALTARPKCAQIGFYDDFDLFLRYFCESFFCLFWRTAILLCFVSWGIIRMKEITITWRDGLHPWLCPIRLIKERSHNIQDRGETALDYACPSWARWRGDRIYFEILFLSEINTQHHASSFRALSNRFLEMRVGSGASGCIKNLLGAGILPHHFPTQPGR